MKSNITRMNLRHCMIGCVLLFPLVSVSTGQETQETSSFQIDGQYENVAELREEVDSVRSQLGESESVGLSDYDLAARALLFENLLVKRKELMKAEDREFDAAKRDEEAVRHDLQKSLAQARDHSERIRILARHQALQRVLAADEAHSSVPTDSIRK